MFNIFYLRFLLAKKKKRKPFSNPFSPLIKGKVMHSNKSFRIKKTKNKYLFIHVHSLTST